MNDIITQTTRWFELAHGDQGYQKRTVQLGVHFEEVGEMLAALKSGDYGTSVLLAEAQTVMEALALHLKQNSKTVRISAERVLLLDSLCDQVVTAAGVAYDFGFKYPQALRSSCATMPVLGGRFRLTASGWLKVRGPAPPSPCAVTGKVKSPRLNTSEVARSLSSIPVTAWFRPPRLTVAASSTSTTSKVVSAKHAMP